MRRILLFLLLGSTIPTLAQEAPGYLVTNKGDTLRGQVHILSYDLMDRVSVKAEGKKKKNLTAVEVRRIFIDSSEYAPVQLENTIRMMKVLKSGYLSLYAFKPENIYTFDGRLLVKMNGSKTEVPNIQFKKILSDFLEDCESTAEKVKIGDLGRGDLEAIIDDYNECVREQNKKTVIMASNASPLTDAIYALRKKVEASSLESKREVTDLLINIDTKVRLKEPVPGYLKDGLKSYLADKKEFEEELSKVLSLLQ
jgi:hypothetical protein